MTPLGVMTHSLGTPVLEGPYREPMFSPFSGKGHKVTKDERDTRDLISMGTWMLQSDMRQAKIKGGSRCLVALKM